MEPIIVTVGDYKVIFEFGVLWMVSIVVDLTGPGIEYAEKFLSGDDEIELMFKANNWIENQKK